MKIKLSKVWKEQVGIIFCFWFTHGYLQKYLKPDSDASMIFVMLIIMFGIGCNITAKTYWD